MKKDPRVFYLTACVSLAMSFFNFTLSGPTSASTVPVLTRATMISPTSVLTSS